MRRLLAGKGWWIALALLVAAIVFGSFQGGDQGRPPERQSVDRGADGFAAWVELLRGAGAEIDERGKPPAAGGLDPASTVVAVDLGSPTDEDVAALREFVEAGGYLIAGGSTDPAAIEAITGMDPAASAGGAGPVQRPLLPVAQTDGVATVDSGTGPLYTDAAGGLPVLGAADGDLLLLGSGRDGSGDVALLASTDALTNSGLTLADNARFALDLGLAEGAGRPVVFLQTLSTAHGSEDGLQALPSGWTPAFLGLLLAALVLILSRVRRLGPPDGDPSPVARPRSGYVDAMARILARRGDLAEAAEPVRQAALEGIARRSGAPPRAADEAEEDADMLASRAEQAGVPAAEAAALGGPLKDPEAAIKAARALARVRR